MDAETTVQNIPLFEMQIKATALSAIVRQGVIIAL